MEITKAKEIKNVKIHTVSLVGSPANKCKFLVTKSKNGKAELSLFFEIIKEAERFPTVEEHYVTGIVYEPMSVDAQDQFMTEEEIVKACHSFFKGYGEADVNHDGKWYSGLKPVESYIAPQDLTIGEQTVKKGSWVATIEIRDNDVWERIGKGEITGFSMAGVGELGTEDVTVTESQTVEPADEKKGILEKIAEMLGINKSNKREEEINLTKTEAQAFIEMAIEKAAEKLTPSAAAPEPAITQDVLQKMVDDAMAKVSATLAKSSDPAMPQSVTEPAFTAEKLQEMVTKSVAEAVEPILKSHGLPTNLSSGEVQKSTGEHYLKGIL